MMTPYGLVTGQFIDKPTRQHQTKSKQKQHHKSSIYTHCYKKIVVYKIFRNVVLKSLSLAPFCNMSVNCSFRGTYC